MRALGIALMLLLSGCVHAHQRSAALPLTDERVTELLEQAPSFRRYREQAAGSVSVVVEHLTPDQAIAAVGHMHIDRFDPAYWFKILADGRVLLCDSTKEEDDQWILDRKPDD